MTTAANAPTGAVGGDATQQDAGGDAIAQPSADASTAAPSAGDASSQDYLGRIRAGGDFATSEVTKHQSRADKMEAEVRRLSDATGGDSGPIGQLVAQGYPPETIKAAFDNYLKLRSDPASQEMIHGFEQTGQVPNRPSATASDDDDEYLSDEQREIRELRGDLQTLRQSQAGLTQSTGTAALQGHLERFARENFLEPAEIEAVKKGMHGQVEQWKTNEPGLKLLRDIQTPSAYDTVDALAWKFVPKEVRFKLGERKSLQDRQRVDGFRTDGPPDTSTTGLEPPAEVKGALAALEYAQRNPNRI